ncbi:MAG: hypothetical protein AAF988_05465 [Pseudomonadota bacterium]
MLCMAACTAAFTAAIPITNILFASTALAGGQPQEPEFNFQAECSVSPNGDTFLYTTLRANFDPNARASVLPFEDDIVFVPKGPDDPNVDFYGDRNTAIIGHCIYDINGQPHFSEAYPVEMSGTQEQITYGHYTFYKDVICAVNPQRQAYLFDPIDDFVTESPFFDLEGQFTLLEFNRSAFMVTDHPDTPEQAVGHCKFQVAYPDGEKHYYFTDAFPEETLGVTYDKLNPQLLPQ